MNSQQAIAFVKKYKWPIVAILLVGLGFMLAQCAHGQAVPTACQQYRTTMSKTVYKTFSPAAPVSAFAAQMLQESSCNATARSQAGAEGLLQFMPETADWIHELDSTLTPARPYNAEWAMMAQSAYMKWLMTRDKGKTECDAFAFALSSYNGGEGWLRRDQNVARSHGLDPLIWFGVVEVTPDRRRSAASIAENRGYPRRILMGLQPRFISAGWGRGVQCGATS